MEIITQFFANKETYMNSLSIREFKQSIQNFVNESELPDEVKRMVINEILADQTQKALESIRAELKDRDREEKKDE